MQAGTRENEGRRCTLASDVMGIVGGEVETTAEVRAMAARSTPVGPKRSAEDGEEQGKARQGDTGKARKGREEKTRTLIRQPALLVVREPVELLLPVVDPGKLEVALCIISASCIQAHEWKEGEGGGWRASSQGCVAGVGRRNGGGKWHKGVEGKRTHLVLKGPPVVCAAAVLAQGVVEAGLALGAVLEHGAECQVRVIMRAWVGGWLWVGYGVKWYGGREARRLWG
ncbi:hypothetical protein C8R44DRAFT_744333 [Mycena epipterygia]|nr:hypothetical protein C8R44DRAFT_744333 [Mycena epipterygia]